MSDLEKNLYVLTEHVRELADKQSAASGRILAASHAVYGSLQQRLWTSHGVASAALNAAVAAVEPVRASAVSNQYKLGMDLHERLNNAAANYENADWRNGTDIGACGL